MQSSFLSMLFRMKYIDRWALMRNVSQENLLEHSLETSMIAHLLATVRNVRFGGNVDADKVAVYAMYHDVTEIITGDLPTPVKYHDEQIKTAYKKMESEAGRRLVSLLPDDLKGVYEPLVTEQADEQTKLLVKAADKLSALVKCIEEKNAGNPEFNNAYIATMEHLESMALPEVDVFINEFLPSFTLTLDEQERN